MRCKIKTCFVAWVVSAFLVSIQIRESSEVKIIACAVALFSIFATWWGFHQTQYPLLQIILNRFVFAMFFIGLLWYNLPLKVAFWACRPTFERIASKLQESEDVKTPFWIGPFRIQYVGLKNDVPYLGTNKGEWEIEGFVRHYL